MKIPTALLLTLCFAFYFKQYAQIYTALILVLVAAYTFFDLAPMKISMHARHLARFTLVALVVMMLVVVPTLLEIQARRAIAPYEHIHDGAIQTEEAIKFLLAGKNPYVEDYTQTPMAQWRMYLGLAPRDNIALFYLPYLPLTFILPIPFYWVSQGWLGFFDLRVYQIILFIILFLLLFQLTQDWDRKLALAILVSLNPLFVLLFVEGRNDVVVLFWFATALYFLRRRHATLAAIALGLSCVVKATAWFTVPFFLMHVWRSSVIASEANPLPHPPPSTTGEGRGGGEIASSRPSTRSGSLLAMTRRDWLMRALLPLVATAALFIAPFVAWDARAFVGGALWYQSSAYQISGQGFSRLLLDMGIIPDQSAPFPFSILQFVVGLPTMIALLRWHAARPMLRRMIAATAALGFVVGYFGRAFADNHVGFILSLALLAVFVDE